MSSPITVTATPANGAPATVTTVTTVATNNSVIATTTTKPAAAAQAAVKKRKCTNVMVYWRDAPVTRWFVKMRGDTELERIRSLIIGSVKKCAENTKDIYANKTFIALYAYPDDVLGNLAWNKHFLSNGGLIMITLSDIGSKASNESVRRALKGFNTMEASHYSPVLSEAHTCIVYAKQEIIDAATARLQQRGGPPQLQGSGSIQTRRLPRDTLAILKGLGFDENDIIFINYTHYY